MTVDETSGGSWSDRITGSAGNIGAADDSKSFLSLAKVPHTGSRVLE
jgi:hypothetical protein